MTTTPTPEPPTRPTANQADWRYGLWQNVKAALLVLGANFSTEIRIAGLQATDIFTMAAPLGATIEEQVVSTLNRMRPVWDPDGDYDLLHFVRHPQTFPDVRLVRQTETGQEPVIGIELKGWYLLAKEEEPSFRYRVTPAACTDWDMLVVVPWYLSEVVSGTPRVVLPFIESARYCAEYRNHWWRHIRVATGPREIISADGASPYPSKADAVLDRAAADTGNNFGRLARTGLLDDYLKMAGKSLLSGIEARHWRAFFKIFQETFDSEDVRRKLERIEAEVGADFANQRRVRAAFDQVLKLFEAEGRGVP